MANGQRQKQTVLHRFIKNNVAQINGIGFHRIHGKDGDGLTVIAVLANGDNGAVHRHLRENKGAVRSGIGGAVLPGTHRSAGNGMAVPIKDSAGHCYGGELLQRKGERGIGGPGVDPLPFGLHILLQQRIVQYDLAQIGTIGQRAGQDRAGTYLCFAGLALLIPANGIALRHRSPGLVHYRRGQRAGLCHLQQINEAVRIAVGQHIVRRRAAFIGVDHEVRVSPHIERAAIITEECISVKLRGPAIHIDCVQIGTAECLIAHIGDRWGQRDFLDAAPLKCVGFNALQILGQRQRRQKIALRKGCVSDDLQAVRQGDLRKGVAVIEDRRSQFRKALRQRDILQRLAA